MPDDRQPWERQKGEPTKAAEAFRIYRDLGPKRSLPQVAEKSQTSHANVARWSRRWNWVERSRAWDDEQDRVGREATLAEVEDMHKRHATLAVTMLNKVAARLIGQKESGITALDPSTMSARDLITMADVAVKLERTARGEIESRIAVEHTGEVSMPANEREQLLSAIAAMHQNATNPPPATEEPEDG